MCPTRAYLPNNQFSLDSLPNLNFSSHLASVGLPNNQTSSHSAKLEFNTHSVGFCLPNNYT